MGLILLHCRRQRSGIQFEKLPISLGMVPPIAPNSYVEIRPTLDDGDITGLWASITIRGRNHMTEADVAEIIELFGIIGPEIVASMRRLEFRFSGLIEAAEQRTEARDVRVQRGKTHDDASNRRRQLLRATRWPAIRGRMLQSPPPPSPYYGGVECVWQGATHNWPHRST
ncbi:hypothetical protein CLOM_g23748 [Closterium sp. NIES-68]|nr:hypothetical protein CLOM_g23748 [Closterium sp. NIES-68]